MEKILLVDDNVMILTVLKDLLETEGYEVTFAVNSAAAMFVLRNEMPDLIFMDILMPGMDGQFTTRLIRMNRKFQDIPIIIFSNLKGTHDALRSKQAGAEVHLKKATPPQEILDTVRQLLDARKKKK